MLAARRCTLAMLAGAWGAAWASNGTAPEGRYWGAGSWLNETGMTLEEYRASAPDCDLVSDELCYTLWTAPLIVRDMELRCEEDGYGHLAKIETAAQ